MIVFFGIVAVVSMAMQWWTMLTLSLIGLIIWTFGTTAGR